MQLPGRLDSAWWALKFGLGLGPLAGLDKFFNLLTDWKMYLSPLVARFLPFSGALFMRGVGGIVDDCGAGCWKPYFQIQ